MIRAVLGMGIIAGLWFMSPDRDSSQNAGVPLAALLHGADSQLARSAAAAAGRDIPVLERAVAVAPASVRRIVTDGAVPVEMPPLRK